MELNLTWNVNVPSKSSETFLPCSFLHIGRISKLPFEEDIPQEDGIHTYISVKFPLCDADDNPYAVCGISTDITQRQQAQARLRRERDLLNGIIELLRGEFRGDDPARLGIIRYSQTVQTQCGEQKAQIFVFEQSLLSFAELIRNLIDRKFLRKFLESR